MKSTEYALADEHRVQPAAEANANIEADACNKTELKVEREITRMPQNRRLKPWKPGEAPKSPGTQNGTSEYRLLID